MASGGERKGTYSISDRIIKEAFCERLNVPVSMSLLKYVAKNMMEHGKTARSLKINIKLCLDR